MPASVFIYHGPRPTPRPAACLSERRKPGMGSSLLHPPPKCSPSGSRCARPQLDVSDDTPRAPASARSRQQRRPTVPPPPGS
ncbi:hypothetical protein EVG20_g7065 [Dentipellis fragilis]|uniref:Uncharacterized protein n=1 Tax=Dentipellis fragilis TaxID=205917 RepID=A0A4Y9YKG1_9AGAM|nr:hypothetical protein EVG20_g7065 [Dentipellis fragilis]